MKDRIWQERASFFICVGSGLTVAWLLIRYAAAPLAMLLVAWGMAALVTPLAKRISRALGVPRRLCAAVLVLLLFFGVGSLIAAGAARVWQEMERLFAWLMDNREWLQVEMDRAAVAWEELLSGLPFGGGALSGGGWEETILGWVDQAVSALGSALATGLGSMAKGLPRLLVLLVVSVMACLYLSMDYERLRDGLIGMLPPRVGERVNRLRARGARALKSYVSAYLLLMAMTFLEVLFGLWILRVPYALLIALGVAAVDILPVVGAGAILIPWAIAMLSGGSARVGVGLLILYGVITIIRQIAEPRLVGDRLGLHPLVSLLSMFFGFWLFGFFGMLLAPFAALLIKECLPKEEKGKI